MFAVIQNKTVIGFITDEDQKSFLIEQIPNVSFAEFDWDYSIPDNYIYPSDMVVNSDGTVTIQKAA